MDFLHKVNPNGWIALSLLGCCGIILLVLATTKIFRKQRYKRTNSISSLSPTSSKVQPQSILIHHLLKMPETNNHHLTHSYESMNVRQEIPYQETLTTCTPKMTAFMSCLLPQSKTDDLNTDKVFTDHLSPINAIKETTTTSIPKHHMVTCLPSAMKASLPWTSTDRSKALWGMIGSEALILNSKMSGHRREKHLLIYPQIPAEKLPRMSILGKRNSTNFRGKECRCKNPVAAQNLGHDNTFDTSKDTTKWINKSCDNAERPKCEPGRNKVNYGNDIIISPTQYGFDNINENITKTLKEIYNIPQDERKGFIQNKNLSNTYTNGIVHFSLEYHHKSKAFVINVSKITGLTAKAIKKALNAKEQAKNGINTELSSLTDSGLGVWEKNSYVTTSFECDSSTDNSCEPNGQLDNPKLVQVYVEIELLPERKQVLKTRQISKNLSELVSKSLVFEEEFTIYGDLSVDQIMDTALLMRVIILNSPRDYKEREMIIGEAYLPLNDVAKEFMDKMVVVCQELHPLLLLDSLGSPTMCLQPKEEEKYRGDLYLCLSLLLEKASLEVVILKAKNLRSPCTPLIDPYVKICLKNQESICIGKQKTKVRRRTINPVFNEKFIFAIPGTFDIKDIKQSPLATFSLEITVRDWAQERTKFDLNPTRKPKYRVLGRCKLKPAIKGDLETSTTLLIQDHHMKDMLGNPNKRVPRWHRLYV